MESIPFLFFAPLSAEISSSPGIICGAIWGSFVGQDHLRDGTYQSLGFHQNPGAFKLQVSGALRLKVTCTLRLSGLCLPNLKFKGHSQMLPQWIQFKA